MLFGISKPGATTQPSAAKACGDLFPGLIVGKDDDLDARLEQRRDDVALQKIDDSHAVVGGDEDAFGHVG